MTFAKKRIRIICPEGGSKILFPSHGSAEAYLEEKRKVLVTQKVFSPHVSTIAKHAVGIIPQPHPKADLIVCHQKRVQKLCCSSMLQHQRRITVQLYQGVFIAISKVIIIK